MKESIQSTRTEPYRIDVADLKKYAQAIIQAARIIEDIRPNVLYCPLRGAYPVVSLLHPLINGYVDDIDEVPTSGFLREHPDIIRNSFENILGRYPSPHVAVIDTVITGSSIRHFRRLVKEYLARTVKPDKNAKVSFIKIWQNREFEPRSIKKYARSCGGNSVEYADFDIGVGSLICEDNPDILGIDYPYADRNDRKFPFALSVECKAPIVVMDGGVEQTHEPDPSTAETFLKLVEGHVKK